MKRFRNYVSSYIGECVESNNKKLAINLLLNLGLNEELSNTVLKRFWNQENVGSKVVHYITIMEGYKEHIRRDTIEFKTAYTIKQQING